MGDIIPWRKKKQRLDWIEGVTPRKKQPLRVSRDTMAAALAIGALAALYLLFSADFSLLGWP